MKRSTPLRLPLVASPALAAWIVAAHATAGGCIALAWPALPGFLAAALLLMLGVASGWRLALLGAAASPAALVLGEEGTFTLELHGGRQVAALAGPRWVTRGCVVLRTGSAGCRTVLVAAGMLPPADFRRLRIWALWGRLPGGDPAGLAA